MESAPPEDGNQSRLTNPLAEALAPPDEKEQNRENWQHKPIFVPAAYRDIGASCIINCYA
jgi:hypothetical protein